MRQLSSLSRHADNIFGELYHEAMRIEHRTNTVRTRMDRLSMKETKLDSNEEESEDKRTNVTSSHTFAASLQDILLRKPFKSNTLIDQQSLSRQTMPNAMGECYSQCERPPDLDALNVFRY